MAEEQDEILGPADLGRKLVIALRSVSDPQALMQSVADRANLSLRSELMPRINSIEKAVEVAHDDLVRVPTEVQKAIMSLSSVVEKEIRGDKQLYMEKFNAISETVKVLKDTINDRFTQNDQNTEKAFNAAKQAVAERDASNAKSADKSEANLTKIISALDDNVKTLAANTEGQIRLNKGNTDDKISDMKDRMASLENRITGGEGKSSVMNPNTSDSLGRMANSIMHLSANASENTGVKRQSDDSLKTVLTVGGMLIALIAVLLTVFEIMKSSGAGGN